MKISRPVAFGMGAIMTLVIGSGTAYAATGGKFILGHKNHAGQTTTLANKHGTALSLKSKAGTPSLTVNRTTKVPNLNADMIDGLDSTKLALASGGVKAYDATGVGFDFDDVPGNEWIVAIAQCPAGTIRTGGGATDLTSTGYVVTSAPDTDNPNAWGVAVFVDQSLEVPEDPSDVFASVVCYSPRGVPSGGYRMAPADTTSTPSAAFLQRLANAGR